MTRLILILMLVLIIAVGGIGYVLYGSAQATDALYDEYETRASMHTTSAYVPGVGDNPVRRELNQALSGILGADLTEAERLELAHRGLTLLTIAEEQVDAIGSAGEMVLESISSLEADSRRAENLYLRGDLEEVVGLARERVEIIADIRALSYRANSHMEEIFRRIIADQGVLTNSYVAQLNRDLPMMEEQYNMRTNLYFELEDISSRISKLLSER